MKKQLVNIISSTDWQTEGAKINNNFNKILPDAQTLTTLLPSKIYTVCNDIEKATAGFASRNYAACVYLDRLLKLTVATELNFKSTKSDKLPLFAPISEDNVTYNSGNDVNIVAINETIEGKAIDDINISFSHISTKASVSAASFPKVLTIGDSTVYGFLANTPIQVTGNSIIPSWAYANKFFKLDNIADGGGHNCKFIGKLSNNSMVINGETIKSYAEGRGGWKASDYLYVQNYQSVDNYFYDAANTGVKFSLSKYLSNYKTLADDGVTRLQVGTTAGALVTDVNAYDVCTPTHVVIQLGFNDAEADFITNLQLMINSIKSEFPDMIIIISTIDAAGTYFPYMYPQFDAASVNMLGDGLHNKMFNLTLAVKALENVSTKIFYCPNYFIQPTAWGVAFRDVDFPENIANPIFTFKKAHGAGNNYHPNTYAHAAWGYQLYSLIKYTLTL